MLSVLYMLIERLKKRKKFVDIYRENESKILKDLKIKK
jgi:hypothetical protein